MFTDKKTNQGFWIRYAILLPSNSAKSDVPEGATLWFGYSNLITPSKNFVIKKFYPLDAVKVTGHMHTTDCTIISIGSSILKLDMLNGGFETKSHRISWDLQLTDFLPPYNSTPKIFKTLGFTNTLNIATHPSIAITGILSIDGKTVNLEGRGLQYHTYGDSYTTTWEWANAYSFDHHPSAFLDFGYKEDKGVLEFFDGKRRVSVWNNGLWSKLRSIKKIKRTKTHTKVTFSMNYKDIIISGEISTPKERLLAVEYLGPNNTRFYCYNTSQANLILTVKIGSDVKTYSVEGKVAFETVHRQPLEGINFLSWEQESL